VQRLAQVVDRAGQRREVVDDVHRLVDFQMEDHVVVDEHERVVPKVLEVLQRAALEVVDADDAMVLREQVLAKVGAEEPGPAGNDCSRHSRDGIGLIERPSDGLRTPYRSRFGPFCRWISRSSREERPAGAPLCRVGPVRYFVSLKKADSAEPSANLTVAR
jgi:hypothetical protein